jgi:phosphotriesterase-related protein
VAAVLPTPFAFAGRAPAKIPTATGEILPGQMGITSVHEHIPMPTDPAQREKSMAFAISELKKAKAVGLQTIIDVGPTDDVAGIREASLATGVNVVCCTGSYILKDEQQSMTVADFENRMRRDVEDGLQGTQIRPGVIKVATRRLPITPAEKNLLIAAARVQKRYNLTICTHAVSGCAEQQQILEEAGADLRHCYFSHVEATFGWSGRTVEQEIDYLQGVVNKGSSLSFNNFGNWNHTKPTDLARIILELTKRGYDDRMVATIDLTWTVENGNIKILWGDTNEDGNDRTYSYPLRTVVPWMKEQGLPKATIDKFMIDNPRRLFTWG